MNFTWLSSLIASHSGQKRILDRGVYTNAAISYLFRDGYALNYALEYTSAKEREDKDAEIRWVSAKMDPVGHVFPY